MPLPGHLPQSTSISMAVARNSPRPAGGSPTARWRSAAAATFARPHPDVLGRLRNMLTVYRIRCASHTWDSLSKRRSVEARRKLDIICPDFMVRVFEPVAVREGDQIAHDETSFPCGAGRDPALTPQGVPRGSGRHCWPAQASRSVLGAPHRREETPNGDVEPGGRLCRRVPALMARCRVAGRLSLRLAPLRVAQRIEQAFNLGQGFDSLLGHQIDGKLGSSSAPDAPREGGSVIDSDGARTMRRLLLRGPWAALRGCAVPDHDGGRGPPAVHSLRAAQLRPRAMTWASSVIRLQAAVRSSSTVTDRGGPGAELHPRRPPTITSGLARYAGSGTTPGCWERLCRRGAWSYCAIYGLPQPACRFSHRLPCRRPRDCCCGGRSRRWSTGTSTRSPRVPVMAWVIWAIDMSAALARRRTGRHPAAGAVRTSITLSSPSPSRSHRRA